MHLAKVTIFPEKFPATHLYPFNLSVFHQKTTLDLSNGVTFFMGENGAGKSTLLDAIARHCSYYGWQGTDKIRYNRSPYEDDFHQVISIEWTNGRVPGSFFSSQVFRNFTNLLDEWATSDPKLLDYFGGKPLRSQSHGQSMMSFFKSRFKIKGLYLLDEPETALSPRSQLELLNIVYEMSTQGHAQFIIATHSPILPACPGAFIYSFDQTPIQAVAYEETNYYRIYKQFLNDPGRFIGPSVPGP
jgi:predicted ATPase